MQNYTLTPGEYFVEMEFDRPVDQDLLLRVLAGMGWTTVVLDQSLGKTNIGALPIAAAAKVAAVATKPMVTSAVSAAMAPKKTASPLTPAASKPAPAAAPAASAAAVQAATRIPISAVPVAPRVSLPTPIRPATAYKPGITPSVQAVPAAKPKPGFASPMSPGGGLGGGGGGGSAPKPTAPTAPSPVAAPPPTDPSATEPGAYADPEGGGGGGGGGGSFSPSTEAAPAEEEMVATSAPAPDMQPLPSQLGDAAVAATLIELWRRWKEWGNPFMQNDVSTSGEGNPVRYRFMGFLDKPLELHDRPHARWLFVKRLAIPAFSEPSLRHQAHALAHGKTYEFRFLARAKSTPTRESICQSLREMGFEPVKLLALKRNMRLPGRPGASLTLWYGMGQWTKADSIVVADDPFHFEEIAEVHA